MPGGLLGALGQFFHAQAGHPPAAPQPTATQTQLPEFQPRSVPAFRTPLWPA